MSRLVYLDFLRQVTPPDINEELLPRDFIIFGGFDALRVDCSAETIREMKRKHEEGHETIAAVYDRQPMFLYKPDPCDSENVFSVKDQYSDRPLVVSIIQINKKSYAGSKDASATDLTQRFDILVNELVNDEKGKYNYDLAIEWSVFWNLGESDVVIAFRANYLHPIAKIIHKIRTVENKYFQVLSTCSHCGFPWNINREETRGKLIQWLIREKSVHKTGFISFINTSSAYHRLHEVFDKPEGIQGAFLFGEWDYSSYQNFNEETAVDKIADQILLSAYSIEKQPYKTSYTLPAVIIDDPGEVDGQRLSDSEEWIKRISDKFGDFISSLKEIKVPDEIDGEALIPEKSLHILDSLSHTFVGLGKFLLRLYYGRYEQDLYAYAKPVFEAIPNVIDNYNKEINGIRKNSNLLDIRKGKIISRLIMEVVDDCTQLISSLQHLFAILSVSPHTFMETYGSNMRSLTAADKLVDAYQGLISYLCKEYPDVIKKDEKSELLGTHYVMIVPHRQSYPLHTLFFKSASPNIRISRIEMDFPRMFEIRASVYVILHECAHHLGDRMRTKRYESYYRACAYLAAESILGKYLYQPVVSFISTTSQSILDESDSLLFRGLMDTDRKTIIKKCKKDVIERACLGIDALAGVIEDMLVRTEHLRDQEKGISFKKEIQPDFERLFREQYYSTYIHAYIHGLFRTVFPLTENGLSEKARTVYNNVIQKHFTDGMIKISENLADVLHEKGGNVFEASRLLTKYRAGRVTDALVEHISEQIQQKIRENAFSDLLDVYTDVYADIFAIQILGIPDFRAYCEMMNLFTGTAIYKAITRRTNILRIATIGNVCFGESLEHGGEKVLRDLIVANRIPSWQHDEIAYIWNTVLQARYLEEIKEYAEECKKEIDKTVNRCLKEKQKELMVLRSIFSHEERDGEIRFIEVFWKYLLEEQV